MLTHRDTHMALNRNHYKQEQLKEWQMVWYLVITTILHNDPWEDMIAFIPIINVNMPSLTHVQIYTWRLLII